MNKIYHDIFKAIHEGKWLKIEYRNKGEEVTKFWIGIRSLDVAKRKLLVDGLHIGMYTIGENYNLSIDNILSTQIIEGSFCPVNEKLVEDIYLNPHKYKTFFDNTANLKILNYLEMCNKMDTTPYYSDFELIRYLDREKFMGESYQLSNEQFQQVVKNFQYGKNEKKHDDGRLSIQQLGMNVLSIHTPKGLYVLAYRKLQLDVKRKVLRPDEDITICTEFVMGESKESIRKFLDADEYELLKDFEKNQEKIKDCVTKHSRQVLGVDDMPYIIGLGMDIVLDLNKEYQAIIKMYQEDKVTIPIKAFFGDLVSKPRRTKEYPITLINSNINLDQLLAINNGMKYPLAYIQGPPGTGKTNTIINTIITAFFNERTVLFTSYNNHPINGVFEKLTDLRYKGKQIPFPVLRLGNYSKVQEAIEYIKNTYQQAEKINVFESTLDRKKDDRIERAKRLSNLLKKYEEVLDLKDRQDAINQVMEYQNRRQVSMEMLPFQTDLQGRQLGQVQKKIAEAGEFTDADAMALLDSDFEQLKMYLYYTSARYIKKLGDSRYKDLYNIIFNTPEDQQVDSFSKYLGEMENVKKLQKIFPIIITTCISAHKLGEPTSMFDMVIMDEASQCNTAVSLVPIIRGDNLMLVGDPQQLSPVILLDDITNQKLRRKYNIADEYDYRKNSIYKTYLACDAVSDEVLLHNHYRCNKKIIGFNNKKYYNSKLKVCSCSAETQPLLYVDVRNGNTMVKNTAPGEVDAIIQYASTNKDKTIGVITPFVNQKKLIEEALKRAKLDNVVCGTVHAFQGDEKDVVLFSTALTDQTGSGTYEWLKNNKELLNVATSRARDKLIVLSDSKNLKRLHEQNSEDDIFELVEYVQKNGQSHVTEKRANSRALSFMKKLGQEPDEKGRLDALECSPYLYLQILFLFTGMPNGAKESLITIDEAQNMAPEELKLIKAINGSKVIFNLFGDVKQHVEGSKGIDDWKKIADIANFKKEYMQENYRNARQITSYCNKRLKLNMRAINLDGTGVHECKNKDEFEAAFTGIFQKPQNVGLSCIIVKNKAEAETLLDMVGNFKVRIYNMTNELVELQRNKWNLMTAEQAKGLEFETVFAVSGRMSENEKYIAYTRALDELYVYDEEIDLIEITPNDISDLKIERKLKEESTRKKRVKRSSKEVKENEISMR